MNYINKMQIPATAINYVEPINAWDSHGISKDDPTRVYFESKVLTFKDYIEMQRRSNTKISLGRGVRVGGRSVIHPSLPPHSPLVQPTDLLRRNTNES